MFIIFLLFIIKIVKELRKKNILVNINYPYPIHKMEAYKNTVCNDCDCLPITEKMARGIFSLPLYPNLKISSVKKISATLKTILKNLI